LLYPGSARSVASRHIGRSAALACSRACNLTVRSLLPAAGSGGGCPGGVLTLIGSKPGVCFCRGLGALSGCGRSRTCRRTPLFCLSRRCFTRRGCSGLTAAVGRSLSPYGTAFAAATLVDISSGLGGFARLGAFVAACVYSGSGFSSFTALTGGRNGGLRGLGCI